MRYELFIARRISSKEKNKGSISRPIIKIAIIAIALGISIMLIAIATGNGFQKKIREKVAGFSGHMQITNFDNNNSKITLIPTELSVEIEQKLNQFETIESIQYYATKGGLIRTEKAFEGVVFKGVTKNYNWRLFESYIKEGRRPNLSDEISNEVLISSTVAKRMGFKLGDEFNIFFLKEKPSSPPWVRVLKIAGIYETGFAEFDKAYIFSDLRHIQKMNRWSENEVGGIEILINDFNKIEETSEKVYKTIDYNQNCQTLIEQYPTIFEWISLFDNNTAIIIFIMILVSGINMITALIVLILERTQMIGILKAFGASNTGVRKIFWINAGRLILRGLFWGNLIGLTLLYLQQKFGLISLDPLNYHISQVPIHITLWQVLLLNLGTLLLCMLALILPTSIITKINPIRVIKFN